MNFSKALLSIAALIAFAVIPTGLAEGQANGPTNTTAQPTVNTDSRQDERPPVFITFTPIQKGISPTPAATYGCSLPYPTGSDTFSTGTATWSANIACTISVGLYGTTVLFNTANNGIIAYGNQINTTAVSASSSGSHSGLAPGTYQVNFNIDITPPAGYTTTVGSGCSYVNGGPEVLCTVSSGPFTQP
jgi:hypothetical protein